VLLGYMGLFMHRVDSDLMAICMIAIGIGVDDTIHFLMRLRIEGQRQETTAAAVRETFYFSGRGIMMTSVILVLGFLPFALSEYLSLFMLGTLLPVTLIVALAADLYLVPALVHVRVIRYR
ncbi:MAG TPA: MMPL family transporter, partial [bacterium]|nr:MMPL family transporter [bacterium]